MNVFIFRRDLRIEDNTGLYYIIKNFPKEDILPVFIFTPEQIDKSKNNFFSDNSVQFMCESLEDLEKNIHINFYYGKTKNIIKNIIKKYPNIKRIVVNEDYTPYSIKRDLIIKNICSKKNIEFKSFQDIPLGNFKQIKTGSGLAYKRFKFFYKKTMDQQIKSPTFLTSKDKKILNNNLVKDPTTKKLNWLKKKFKPNSDVLIKGGRSNGLSQVKEGLKLLKDYNDNRMFPLVNSKHPTTLLSAFLKYGTISVREVYSTFLTKVSKNHPIIRQLIWKDFYYNLIFYYPHIFTLQTETKLNNFKWKNNKQHFKNWCEGETGYPFIDAGMRQLNKTGYMPNRLRLACSSFLIKNLHINWKWGEKYFAQKLIDYDPAINNGNWQWVSSTGYESQAYYRFLNPITDISKFDSDCEYIKLYVEELREINPKIIKKWHEIQPNSVNYSKPIVEFKESINEYKDLSKRILY